MIIWTKKGKCVIRRKQYKEARVAAGCILWGEDRIWANVLQWEEILVHSGGGRSRWQEQKVVCDDPRSPGWMCAGWHGTTLLKTSVPQIHGTFKASPEAQPDDKVFLWSKCKCWQFMQIQVFRSNWPVCANLTTSACSSWKNTTWAYSPPDMSLETS